MSGFSKTFRTITEVATELKLPPYVLRFWESKFSVIAPVKRGGGRRYYTEEDVENLMKIKGLLYGEGYTIKGVQKLIKEGGFAGREQAAGREGGRPLTVVQSFPLRKSADSEAPLLRDSIRKALAELYALKDSLANLRNA